MWHSVCIPANKCTRAMRANKTVRLCPTAAGSSEPPNPPSLTGLYLYIKFRQFECNIGIAEQRQDWETDAVIHQHTIVGTLMYIACLCLFHPYVTFQQIS